jgi:hypothetical protein
MHKIITSIIFLMYFRKILIVLCISSIYYILLVRVVILGIQRLSSGPNGQGCQANRQGRTIGRMDENEDDGCWVVCDLNAL